jgi:hypothetical protein
MTNVNGGGPCNRIIADFFNGWCAGWNLPLYVIFMAAWGDHLIKSATRSVLDEAVYPSAYGAGSTSGMMA